MTNLDIKLFEVRDHGTRIDAIAIRLSGYDGRTYRENTIIRHAGYDTRPCILYGNLRGGPFSYDPYDWGDRTMHATHLYIQERWDELASGDVVDARFALGETESPTESEDAQVTP